MPVRVSLRQSLSPTIDQSVELRWSMTQRVVLHIKKSQFGSCRFSL
jgi:hypothetical protein